MASNLAPPGSLPSAPPAMTDPNLPPNAAINKATSSNSDYEMLQQGLTLATQVIDTRDPRVNVAVWKARVENYKQMKKRFPALAFVYDNEIRKLESKIKATEELIQVRRDSEAGWRSWRFIGQGALTVGVASASILLLVLSARILGGSNGNR